jgi:prepilin-type N-terminal cleavage/methylation domain-containing protein
MGASSLGFTLLELLVVLVITGLVAGIVAPNIMRRMDTMGLAFEQRAIEAQIETLPRRIRMLGKVMQLDTAALHSDLGDGAPAINVPLGWQVQLPTAIQFASNGTCSGGTVTVQPPASSKDSERVYTLRKVTCRVQTDS